MLHCTSSPYSSYCLLVCFKKNTSKPCIVPQMRVPTAWQNIIFTQRDPWESCQHVLFCGCREASSRCVAVGFCHNWLTPLIISLTRQAAETHNGWVIRCKVWHYKAKSIGSLQVDTIAHEGKQIAPRLHDEPWWNANGPSLTFFISMQLPKNCTGYFLYYAGFESGWEFHSQGD